MSDWLSQELPVAALFQALVDTSLPHLRVVVFAAEMLGEGYSEAHRQAFAGYVPPGLHRLDRVEIKLETKCTHWAAPAAERYKARVQG